MFKIDRVRWKYTSLHYACNADFLSVTGTDSNIVQEVPIFRLWVHPCRFEKLFVSCWRMPFQLAFPIFSLPIALFHSLESPPTFAFKSSSKDLVELLI